MGSVWIARHEWGMQKDAEDNVARLREGQGSLSLQGAALRRRRVGERALLSLRTPILRLYRLLSVKPVLEDHSIASLPLTGSTAQYSILIHMQAIGF